jgi:hypothetical protein
MNFMSPSIIRIASLGDFEPNSNICFKRLIMPTYPTLPFITSSPPLASGVASTSVSNANPPKCISSIFQRFNVINRNAHNVLLSSIIRTNELFQIILLKRTLSNKQGSDPTSSYNRPILDDLEESIKLITSALNAKASDRGFTVNIRILEYLKTPYPDQVRILSNSSLVIGLESSSILSAVNLPIGVQRCCGVLELRPQLLSALDNSTQSTSNPSPVNLKSSYNNNDVILTQFGLHYQSVAIYSESTNFKLPIDIVVSKIEEIINLLNEKSTCLSSSVAKNPYGV